MAIVLKHEKINPSRLCKETFEQLKQLGKDYQLFFFFRGDCLQSRRLAITVSQFAQIYGWTVWAISLNGSTLPEFPTPHAYKNFSNRIRLKVIPALIAMHAHSKFYVPISYGPATLDEIEGELEILVSHEAWRKH